MINGVIFDFNGTLLDDGKYHFEAWKQLAKKYFDYNLTEKELQYTLNGLPNEAIINYLAKANIIKEDNLKYSKEKEALYRQALIKAKPSLIKGAVQLFQTLNTFSIPFTIASASIKENIDFFIEFFELNKYMDTTKIIYDDGTFNNKEEMYTFALKSLKLNPEQTLIFEDSLSGIKGAINNKTKVIAIYNKNLEGHYKNLNILKIIHDYNDLNIEKYIK